MFSHFRRPGKCEWIDNGLESFVAHYNRECGTAYVHSKCLDVERVGGNTGKEPEVLVVDEHTNRQMAIEHKRVVWPPYYILRHENEHAFAETIWQATRGHYGDGCWELGVSGKEMDSLDNRAVRRIAQSIGMTLVALTSAEVPVNRSMPVNWSFRRVGAHEHEGQNGIVVSYQDSTTFEDFFNDEAKHGTAKAMEVQLAAAAAKFEKYAEMRRVVLVDFYGRALHEEDIPALIGEITIPPNLDEIWMSRRDWISEDHFEIGYERLFS